MTLVTREGKGSELTWDELDDNFIHCLDRANHTGTQPASTISDFNSAAGGVANAAVAAHVAATDPHTQYTTAAEAAAAAPVQSVNGETGAVVLSAADVGADVAGAAAAAIGAHEAALDPHPQYLTQTEGDARYERGLTAGANVTIDRTDPDNPVISAVGGGGGGGAVDSINGQTGVVVLDTDDVAEGVSNLYYTNARASAAAPVQSVNGQTGAVDLSGSYAPLSHVGSGGAAHANVVAGGAAGFMTGADKTKLDGIATGATANANTDSLAEGATNKYFTEGRVRGTVLTGLSLLTGGVISAADGVLSALGKLQKQISDAVTAIGGKQDTLVSGTNIKTVNGSSLLGAGDLAISGSGMANPMTSAGDIIVGGSGGTPARLGMGSALQALRVNSAGTGLEYAALSGGGLTNLTEAKGTAAPNATVPVVSLTVTTTELNGDFALLPKGNGALLAAIPNNTATGGNKRGVYAIDLQRARASASQVASGPQAVIISGENCTASGLRSTIINCWYGTASGNGSGIYSGFNNSAAGEYSTVMGGYENVAAGVHASISGGSYATTRLVSGAEARASGRFAVTGDAQRERFILRRTTTDATPTVLSSDQTAPASTNQVILPNTGTYDFAIRVVARAGDTDQASFRITGLITRGASAGTTAIVGTPTVTTVASSAGASSWSVTVSANTTIGCLAVTVTGAAATSIRWVADVETVEVVG